MYTVDKVQKEKKRMNMIGRIVGIIVYIILIPIIIINFTLIIKSFINPNEIPDFFGYKNFVIVSGSMEPTIMIGDAILIKEVPENEIKINDIISFNQHGIVVTHRVVDIVNDNGVIKFKTKGDNNNAPDKQMTTYEQIEGKFQFKINQFGIILDILKNKITLIVLILIVILMSIYKRNLNKKRQIRREKRLKYEENIKKKG